MQFSNLVHGSAFISHDGAEGRETALWIADHFKASASAVSCWIADRNILDPENAIDDVHRAIQSCACVILVTTNKALEKSSRVQRELSKAFNYKKPIVLASTHECDLLSRLARRPIVKIDLSDDGTFDALLEAVTSTATAEGIRQNLAQYKDDAEDTLQYIRPEHERYLRTKQEISDLEDQINRLDVAIRDPEAARARMGVRIDAGIERNRIPEGVPAPIASIPYVFNPPIEAPPYFENRFDETRAVIDFLKSESGRLIVVTGRGGVGKSSLIARILSGLQRGRLPDDHDTFQVDGIVYLSYVGKKPSLNSLFTGLGQILPEASRQRMIDLLKNVQIPAKLKIAELLSEFPSSPKSNPVVVLVDNMEDGIEQETHKITDPDIREFLKQLTVCVGNRIRVILTSRIAPGDLSEMSPNVKVDLPLTEGLQSPHAENLFKSLDPTGAYGLRDADEKLLDRLRIFTKGYPKAIEAAVTILRNSDISANELLEAEMPDDRVVEVLVGEAFSRLLVDDQLVMEALAVFGQPVRPTAVDYVLRPWFAHIDAALSLGRLANMRLVRKEGANYFQHPIDRQHALLALEQRSPEEEDQRSIWGRRSNVSPSTRSFKLQAAEYFAEVRVPRANWYTIGDIDAHIAEFKMRLDLDDDDSASDILIEIAEFIEKSGSFQLLLNLAKLLEEKAQASTSRKAAFKGAAAAMWRIGRDEEAVQYQSKLIDEMEDDPFDQLLEKCNMYIFGKSMGQLKRALPDFERLCEILNERRWPPRDHCVALHQLGDICKNLGYFDRAIRHQEEALARAKETDDPDNIEAQIHNYASSIRTMGRIDEALDLYKEALDLAKVTRNPLWEANHLSAIGEIERDKGNLGEAYRQFDAELAIRQRIGDVRGIIDNQRREATWLLESGDVSAAESIAKECLAQTLDVRGHTYRIDILLARIKLAEGEWSEAERLAQKSLETNVDEGTFARRNVLAIALAQQGRKKAAISAFKDALDEATEWLDRCDRNADALCHKAISSIGLAILTDGKLDEAIDAFENARAVNGLPGKIEGRQWWFETVAAIPSNLDLTLARCAIDGAGPPHPPPSSPSLLPPIRSAPKPDRVHEILFLAANPFDTESLDLPRECRDVSEAMRRCLYRDRFTFRSGWAVRPRDLNTHILDYRPTIVHFSGHGKGPAGIVLEDKNGRSKLVTAGALEALFSLFKATIDCVVLNCCFSDVQAKAIARHIPHVVGMNKAIGNDAAVEFAIGFYQGLGGGLTYREAFEMGRAAIDLEDIPEKDTPQYFSLYG